MINIREDTPQGQPRQILVNDERFITMEAYQHLRKQYNAARERAEALEAKDRSMRTHAHFFARVNELWQTLPEWRTEPWAGSAEHFRKHALIACGYYSVVTTDCETEEMARMMKPLSVMVAKKMNKSKHDRDGYAVAVVKGPLLMTYTADSQAWDAQEKEVFKEAKNKVLHWMENKVQEPKP